ncbi:MAG: nucleotidyltransferase domain-containing protein [Spirochaetota bacterium]
MSTENGKKLESILRELSQSLKTAFAARLDKVILFGSQARGNADSEADIDVLVVLSASNDLKKDEHSCLSISKHLSLKYDVVISCILANPEDLESKRPLFMNIRREGIIL